MLPKNTLAAAVKLLFAKIGHGCVNVCASNDSPSANQFVNRGSLGVGATEKMLTGARPSIFFNRSSNGRKNFSYGSLARMSSTPNVTTASTPVSPTHCGVVNFGKFTPTPNGSGSIKYT